MKNETSARDELEIMNKNSPHPRKIRLKKYFISTLITSDDFSNALTKLKGEKGQLRRNYLGRTTNALRNTKFKSTLEFLYVGS